MKFFAAFTKDVAQILKNGGVGVLPTDTLYGIVGQARNQTAVENIYRIKGRDPKKPLIILVSGLIEVEEFGVRVDIRDRKILNQIWPGPFSVIFDAAAPEYLTRGQNSLAFRLPDDKKLLALIRKTGPLVAPSANPEGETPAKDITEAVKYFKDRVDFYVDAGKIEREPSTLIKIVEGNIEKLR